MGDYCGNHFKVKLKEEANPRLKELLTHMLDLEAHDEFVHVDFPELDALIGQRLAYPTGEGNTTITRNEIEYLSVTLTGVSSYIQIYNKSKIDGLSFEAFGASKDDFLYVWLAFFNLFKQDFELEDGQIVYRSLYEDGGDEDVIWWDKLNEVFKTEKGWEYGYRFDDPNHPSFNKWQETDDPFTAEELFKPPMNITEICAIQGRDFPRVVTRWLRRI